MTNPTRHSKCNFYLHKPVLNKLRPGDAWLFWAGADLGQASDADAALLQGMIEKLPLSDTAGEYKAGEYKIVVDGKPRFASGPAARVLGETIEAVNARSPAAGSAAYAEYEENNRLIRNALRRVGAF